MLNTQNLPESLPQLHAIIAQQRLQIQEHKRQQKNPQQAETVLIRERAGLLQKVEYLSHENDILREALRLARAVRFAQHSEKFPSNQSELFNEAEVLKATVSEDDPEEDDSDDDVITVPEHKRIRGKRKSLPSDLPREDVVIDLPESEKICSKHGTALKEIGSEVSEKLDVIPSRFKVIRTIRKKYESCPCCQDEAGIITAPLPETILPKSNATPGLLAYIATAKYIDALPLYRLEQIFARNALEIPRNTMARWMIQLTDPILPLYRLMEDDLKASDYISCDETRTQVLKEEGKEPQSQSYMWVRARHGPGVRPIILFDYDPSRSGEVPSMLLEGFQGYLQVDGYAGYNEICLIEGVIRLGCMAHVRRKFFDVLKASNDKSKAARHVLRFIQKLYKIEAEIKDKSIAERFQIRQERAKPILGEIKAWLDANQNRCPPKSLLGIAITYATNQWCHVINYLLDGRLDIDNNFTENIIRPFAVGRKNWLFNDTVDGAKASAMIYSILQTAKANGLDPYAYMRHLLTELPKCKTAEELELLLPYKIDPRVLG